MVSNFSEKGTLYIISSFFLISVTLITISVWKLVEYRIQKIYLRQQELKAVYAAKAGIEEAIFTIKNDINWDYENPDIATKWGYEDPTTFYLNHLSEDLLFFEYPVTISVSLKESVVAHEYDIESKATVGTYNSSDGAQSHLKAHIIKSFTGSIHITSLVEM